MPQAVSLRRIILHAAVISLTGIAAATPLATYDASLGSLPSDQGWTLVANAGDAYVSDGLLTQSTLPLRSPTSGNCVTAGDDALYWIFAGTPFTFDDGIDVSIRMRIVASQNLPCACDPNRNARAGFRIWISDSAGRSVFVTIDEGQVSLRSDANSRCDDLLTFNIDTTSQLNDYTVAVRPTGSALSINGTEVLAIAAGKSTLAVSAAVRIGDSTGWSNSEAEIALMSVSTPNCNPADLAPPFGLLDLADVNAFAAGFLDQAPVADLDADGLFDLTDINIFVSSFLAGCP